MGVSSVAVLKIHMLRIRNSGGIIFDDGTLIEPARKHFQTVHAG
jgi:hypothetical protein